MARLPRLALAGEAHCLLLRGHGARPVFADAADRAAFVAALREAAAAENVRIHAWALLPDEVLLLATPADAPSLGRLVQALGRRYVSAHNRRHAQRGTLWDGRFRCAVVEPGAMRLAVLRWVDGQALEAGITTAGERLGGARSGFVVDPPELWTLGNTPFEREAAYGALLAAGLPADVDTMIRRHVMGGWAIGSAAFVAATEQTLQRPAAPRPRGRPRTSPA